METHELSLENKQLREKLIRLKPGQKVSFTEWRGGKGEGVLVKFVNHANVTIDNLKYWGYDKRDVIVIKRNDSADDGRYFRPFLGDGDTVTVIPDGLG